MKRILIPRAPKPKGMLALLGGGLLGLLLLQSNCLAQTGLTPEVTNVFDKAVLHPAIPLYDEAGINVLQSGKVYSPKKSCEGSGCHDYEKMTHAFHFEMGRDEADDNYGKKRGIPHLVSPGYFGGYNCMGGNGSQFLSKKVNKSPNEFQDYGAADMTKNCIYCHMGGGYDEKDRDAIRYDQKNEADIKPYDGDYYVVAGTGTNMNMDMSTGDHSMMTSGTVGKGYDTVLKRWDWKKSGVAEADCILCHIAMNSYVKFPASNIGKNDLSDKSQNTATHWQELRYYQFAAKGFYREIPTATLEFINLKPEDPAGQQLVYFEKTNFKVKGTLVNGVATAKDTYDLVLDKNGKPIPHWNPKAFDATGKVTIPMLRFTPNENCMTCHTTASSRRGYYGFGEAARMELDPNDGGTFKNDYQDDVHKGKNFTESNGETRAIENCNACHAKNYYHLLSQSPELDLDHNFLKGNSDMDLRNDLDYGPNAKSCSYCHQDIANPVIPSGQKTLLGAHQELWKLNGDMAGYSQDTLTKITKTHLDEVSCEACHITGLVYAGKPMQVLYRYKKQEDGKSRIAPYNPSVRYTWRDRNGDRVLTSAELKMVYKDVTPAAGSPVTQAQIINAMDDSVLGTIGKTGTAYDFPRTYEQFMTLKTAYDKLMEKRGFKGANMQLVWADTNTYTMNHGTKSSPQALQCEQCHERKQNGAWSSLVSPKGVFGEANVKVVGLTVPDPRLVKEGHIRFDAPYMKLDAKNQMTINTADILYTTKVDPFLSLARNSSASTITGELKAKSLSAAMADINMANDPLRATLDKLYGQSQVYYFKNPNGNAELEDIGVVALSGKVADVVLPLYRFNMDVFQQIPQSIVSTLESSVAGSKLSSSVFLFQASDRDKKTVTQFMEPVFVKLPYKGKATNAAGLKILTSVDGSVINQLDNSAIYDVKADTDAQKGYIIFKTSQFAWFAVLDVKK